jgi:hypothetical protein
MAFIFPTVLMWFRDAERNILRFEDKLFLKNLSDFSFPFISRHWRTGKRNPEVMPIPNDIWTFGGPGSREAVAVGRDVSR